MADIVKIRMISIVVFLSGLLFLLMGFSAPQWAEYTDDEGLFYHEGLWKRCHDIGLGKKCSLLDPDWTAAKVKATQANMCLALIMAVASLISYICWMIVKKADVERDGMTDVGRVALYTEAAAGCFNFLAILIYGFYWIYLGSYLHWGFALSVVSSIIFLVHSFSCICLADCSSTSVSRNSHPHDAQYPAVSAYPATHLAGVYPTSQPQRAAVYFVPQNNGGQQVNIMLPQGGADSMAGQQGVLDPVPLYTPEVAQAPPQYQAEWLTNEAPPNTNSTPEQPVSPNDPLHTSGTVQPGLSNPLYTGTSVTEQIGSPGNPFLNTTTAGSEHAPTSNPLYQAASGSEKNAPDTTEYGRPVNSSPLANTDPMAGSVYDNLGFSNAD